MSDDWIKHDGLEVPTSAPVLEVRTRGKGTHKVLSWGWAHTGERSPADVLEYRLGNPFGGNPVKPEDYFPRLDVPAGLTRAAILDQAKEIVTKDRAATHGDLESSFTEIAAIWSVRLGVTVTPAQVCILMSDFKGVRAWHNPGHLDNWVDIAATLPVVGNWPGVTHDPR